LSEFIRFEFLSVARIRRFVESSNDFLGDFTRGIWHSIGNRLILPVDLNGLEARGAARVDGIDLGFNSSEPLKGIIAHLSEKYQGNVHAKGVVTITANSDSGYPAYRLADLHSDNFFNSEDQPDQWFCYDFNDQTILPTHYSIRSYWSADYNPRSWVIESSFDGIEWTELDRKVNSNDLRGERIIRTFPLARSAECRMVRFRQFGQNHANNNYLCLTGFELFGTLQENTHH
jgi:hypothetical protein